MSKVSRWMEAAVRRNVKVIDLTFRPWEQSKDTEVRWILNEKFDDIELPLSLVTCGSLEVLRLFLFGRGLSLPNFTGFPTLRVLELNSIGFAYEEENVEAFFKSLTLLEELSLISCLTHELDFLCISCPNLKNLIIDNREMVRLTFFEAMCSSVRISCPKLVFLELVGCIALKFFFESLDSLKKVVFHAKDINPEGLSLSGISHVESLSLSLYVVLQCLREVDVPASLPNLKTLELTVDDYAHESSQWRDFFSEYWHRDEAVKILARKLRKVEFVEFIGRECQLRTAGFLLEYGNTLEEMVFIWENKARYLKEFKKTMKKVSNFQKASSTVKLISLLKLRVC